MALWSGYLPTFADLKPTFGLLGCIMCNSPYYLSFQKQGAQLVVLEGKRRQVWENMWSDSCLDLHLMSSEPQHADSGLCVTVMDNSDGEGRVSECLTPRPRILSKLVALPSIVVIRRLGKTITCYRQSES